MSLWLSRLLMALGCFLVALGVIYGGMVGYMMWRESASPSTSRVLVLKDGRRIPLGQPTQAPNGSSAGMPNTQPQDSTGNRDQEQGQRSPDPVGSSSAATEPRVEPPSTESAAADGILPPLRLTIPKVGVDWPVVLSDNDHLPRFKAIGWLIGSAYPNSHQGNMVLFGHLDGPYSTLGRLRELVPGDEFYVATEAHRYRYRVREASETTSDDVGVLAPTEAATVTLITCSGRWDPVGRDYSHRLIVVADYVSTLNAER